MSETLKQFMAALHHANWTGQAVVNIGGSKFNHGEIVAVVQELELLIGESK